MSVTSPCCYNALVNITVWCVGAEYGLCFLSQNKNESLVLFFSFFHVVPQDTCSCPHKRFKTNSFGLFYLLSGALRYFLSHQPSCVITKWLVLFHDRTPLLIRMCCWGKKRIHLCCNYSVILLLTHDVTTKMFLKMCFELQWSCDATSEQCGYHECGSFMACHGKAAREMF